jgi:hypothetical protein
LQNALRGVGEARKWAVAIGLKSKKRQQGCWRYESKVQSYSESIISEKQLFVKGKTEKAARGRL